MAQLFDDVFKPSGIYDILFFNVKTILTYPTLEELQEKNPLMYNEWYKLFNKKYHYNVSEGMEQSTYEMKAPNHPEFTKIIAITYAKVYVENGTLKRHLVKIVNDDEYIVLATFIEELHSLSSDGAHSTPQVFPLLCGHNILGHDIPVLVKKFVEYRKRFETNKQLPLIIKRSLAMKPWESGVIDTVNVWKFNGYDNASLTLIANYIGLKKTIEILPNDEVSQMYWGLVKTGDTKKALEFVSLQSATQTNLVIQLVNELRYL